MQSGSASEAEEFRPSTRNGVQDAAKESKRRDA